jgi:hypothetical protein
MMAMTRYLFETTEMIDNKPPLSFYPICHEDRDEVEVLLVDPKPSPITFEETEDKDFKVGINDDKKIVTLLFHNASGRLAKTLPEEERKKLAEEARLMALEVEKYSYRLIGGGEKKTFRRRGLCHWRLKILLHRD